MLHAGRQDVAILRRAWSTELTNIFDTQIAAGFAGASAQAGYGNLLGAILGRRVGKTASYTRWDARPLTDEQLSYAAEDVAHLLELADELQRRLGETGRLEWAREECRRLESATDERDPETAWERLPRVGQLDPARARSRASSPRGASAPPPREDRPVGSVLADPALVEARQAPAVERRRARADPRHPPVRDPAPRPGDHRRDRPRPRGRADPARRAARALGAGDAPLIALAEALLRARALEAGLAYELIASRSELELIVGAARRGEPEPDVRTLDGLAPRARRRRSARPARRAQRGVGRPGAPARAQPRRT